MYAFSFSGYFGFCFLSFAFWRFTMMCFCVVFFVFMCWILLVTWVWILMSYLVFYFFKYSVFPISSLPCFWGSDFAVVIFTVSLMFFSLFLYLSLCEYIHLRVCVIFSFLYQFGCFLIYWLSFLLCLICFSVHKILQAGILEWVTIPFSKESSQPGIEPGFPTSQADSLPSEPPRRSHC